MRFVHKLSIEVSNSFYLNNGRVFEDEKYWNRNMRDTNITDELGK